MTDAATNKLSALHIAMSLISERESKLRDANHLVAEAKIIYGWMTEQDDDQPKQGLLGEMAKFCNDPKRGGSLF